MAYVERTHLIMCLFNSRQCGASSPISKAQETQVQAAAIWDDLACNLTSPVKTLCLRVKDIQCTDKVIFLTA
jgi:hypothetical protein